MLLKRRSGSFPVEFVDHGGEKFEFSSAPERVVCLNPSITEIIRALGAEKVLVGITYHDKVLSNRTSVVGGFLMPSTEKIQRLKPDVIFYSPIQEEIPEVFSSGRPKAIMLAPNSVEELFDTILFLSRLLDRLHRGIEVVDSLKKDIDHLQKKLKKTGCTRFRTIRIMGMEGDRLIIPGKGSFQNIMIKLAGGEPPEDVGEGNAASFDLKQWLQFDPQVVYGCEGDKSVVQKLRDTPGWRDVSAIKENRCFFYPCELTCRLSVRMATFVSRLAADVHVEEFSKEKNWINPPLFLSRREIQIPLVYIKKAYITTSWVFDFKNKSLLIEFKRPLRVISTLEGMRDNILFVGNHYTPPQCWSITHYLGLTSSRSMVYKALGLDKKITSFLFTGADMDNLSMEVRGYGKIKVCVLLTAGVESNAQRMSKDSGDFCEVGTINIIIMTNMRLTPRAMTRAIITATEAKTAALQDMDIRSSYTPMDNQATGTGTDNILVVEGEGEHVLDNAGGHSKLGELISTCVYNAVISAVEKQNQLIPNRNIFSRLMERRINLFSLIHSSNLIPPHKKKRFLQELDHVLLLKPYASFLELCLYLSDRYKRERNVDADSLEKWALSIAEDMASHTIKTLMKFSSSSWPFPLQLAIDAIFTGIFLRLGMEKRC